MNWKVNRVLQDPRLLRRPPCEVVNWKFNAFPCFLIAVVDLLVRSWIERSNRTENAFKRLSTSLWGRELKEIKQSNSEKNIGRPPCEVVNWKTFVKCVAIIQTSRPPCEVVNWKAAVTAVVTEGVKSTSLWGRELKVLILVISTRDYSRPPCEVVNWKTMMEYRKELSLKSTSLWGRELKGLSYS